MKNTILNTLKIMCMAGIIFFAAGQTAYAEEDNTALLTPEITLSNGSSADNMTDDSYYSSLAFNAGDTITLTSTEAISSLYIVWNNPNVAEWTLSYGDKTKQCGTNGFLHEYVELDTSSNTVTITINSDGMTISKLFAFSSGEVPSWVQKWDEPCTNADILLISTHADDEILFFGGILPYYAGELNLRVQVAYYCQFWNSASIREHEKLDGLWVCGVNNYPVNGNFDDIYCTDLESAKTVYSYNDSIEFMTELIRRFKPLVLVGQDLNGEYGHGGHMITAAAICDAVEISADASNYPDSAALYGTYDVPKTYLHLYGENSIDLDCQRTLNAFDGKTVLQVAEEAYEMHVSQQWCWFYVSDSNAYSCGRYGLYRTTVGNDTESDIMCNLVTYEEQESIAAAKEAASIAEAESIAASIAESEEASIHEAEQTASKTSASSDKSSSNNTLLIILICCIAVLVLLILILASVKRKKR